MKKTIYIFAIFVAFAFCTVQSVKAQEEDIGRLLQQLENSSDRFSHSFDNALDNSEINGTSTEGDATRYVKEFEDSIDELKRDYDNNRDAKISAANVLAKAKVINKVMKKYKLDAASQTDWTSVKTDIGRLAKAHNLKIKW